MPFFQDILFYPMMMIPKSYYGAGYQNIRLCKFVLHYLHIFHSVWYIQVYWDALFFEL
ncbi:053R [Invertebrate iridescent virus Kaz2018]|uniref:Uncharacterized protein n=1 Tax=Iridovirus sp. TaxID=135728 RepID=A0AAU7YCR1_9VIRU|nr:053R [Invertebrate iridescent virus Kaz2018]